MIPQSHTIELNVAGMHCSNCALSVHQLLEKKGMSDIYVNFVTEEVRFTTTDTNKVDALKKEISRLGYQVSSSGEEVEQEKFYQRIENKFLFSLIFTIPLFIHMFLSWHILHLPWVQFSLCLPVFVVGIFHFGRSAWHSINNKLPNMDVLIFIGSSSAFLYSFIGTFLHLGSNYLFYETTATIITLVLLGNWLEKKSVLKTTTAIKELLQYQKTTAKRINNGKTEQVPVEDVIVGDTLQVNDGDKIAVDGEIISGFATLNESMLTGESVPVEKKKYDTVFGGTIVVEGNFTMLASKVGKHTTLSHIIALMKQAQALKPSIQKVGDKVAAIFVPVVLAIAILTFSLAYFVFHISSQQALLNAIAVLVISCPCAMGLATPTAVAVGLGRATQNGILIKGGDTVEALTHIKYFIFDKTGTLTTGKFKIQEIKTFGISLSEAQQIIFNIEERSNHPIARSIVEELSEHHQKMIFTFISEEKGLGMKAIDVEGNIYRIGSRKILESVSSQWTEYDLFLTKNDTLLAVINISDQIKLEAYSLIDELKKMGITPVLLSGDSLRKSQQVAHELKIVEFYAEKLPQEKLAIIQQYKNKAKTVMVGDGINDAPALTLADVGISLSNASQIAIQSAQVILLTSDLRDIKFLINVCRQTLITIKQNLFWAFFYNLIAIPVAAFGFLNPMVGAMAMALSDVIVIGNSIRLKYKKINN